MIFYLNWIISDSEVFGFKVILYSVEILIINLKLLFVTSHSTRGIVKLLVLTSTHHILIINVYLNVLLLIILILLIIAFHVALSAITVLPVTLIVLHVMYLNIVFWKVQGITAYVIPWGTMMMVTLPVHPATTAVSSAAVALRVTVHTVRVRISGHLMAVTAVHARMVTMTMGGVHVLFVIELVLLAADLADLGV